MRVWFWSSILVSVFVMKLWSLGVARVRPDAGPFLWGSPLLSTLSWDKRTPVRPGDLRSLLLRAACFLALALLSWWLYLSRVPPLHASTLVRCYLALVPLYLFGQLASLLLELAFLPTRWHFPPHFRFPPLSTTLTEFWGERWGTWVSDWFEQVVFTRFPRRPSQGLFAVFAASGLWHEALINVPLYLFCRVNLLGSMMVYFPLQAAGIWVERKFLWRHPAARYAFAWAVVLVPAPLVINAGILRAFGLLNP